MRVGGRNTFDHFYKVLFFDRLGVILLSHAIIVLFRNESSDQKTLFLDIQSFHQAVHGLDVFQIVLG